MNLVHWSKVVKWLLDSDCDALCTHPAGIERAKKNKKVLVMTWIPCQKEIIQKAGAVLVSS